MTKHIPTKNCNTIFDLKKQSYKKNILSNLYILTTTHFSHRNKKCYSQHC